MSNNIKPMKAPFCKGDKNKKEFGAANHQTLSKYTISNIYDLEFTPLNEQLSMDEKKAVFKDTFSKKQVGYAVKGKSYVVRPRSIWDLLLDIRKGEYNKDVQSYLGAKAVAKKENKEVKVRNQHTQRQELNCGRFNITKR